MTDAADDLDEPLLAAYIGPGWERHYRERFARFRRHPWRILSWNWAAALVPFWPVWWNLGAAVVVYLPAAMMLPVMGAPGPCGVSPWQLPTALLTVGAAGGLVEGLFGDWALFLQARSAVRRARRLERSDEDALSRIQASRSAEGSPARAIVNRVGGALLLLLLGVVCFTFPVKFASTKAGAYRAAMKSDLRNLVTAQEAFHTDSSRYATSPSELERDFWPSAGVSLRVLDASPSGFAALGTHNVLTRQCGERCGIFVGTARPPWPLMTEGEPLCRRGTR